jgi:HD-GYP domain-containing protein (c-di-GMP phosphodiesterase class II)
MQYIHSKDIFSLLRDTLKLLDKRPIVHGGKVAYYVYKMMEHKGDMEKYELADLVFLATFHDIGAYKTDSIEQMLRYETKEFGPHSTYGQLLFENLTLLRAMSPLIKYHHTEYATLQKTETSKKELISSLQLAEMIDLFRGSLGEKFSLDVFKSQLGSKFSPEAYEMFCKVHEQEDLFAKVDSGDYKKELGELMEFFILTNEEKEKWMEFLMFTLAFKSDSAVRSAAACVALCEKVGTLMRLDSANQDYLRYAAYLHDIGYLGFRKEWIEHPAKLNQAHKEKLAHHTLMMENLLKERMQREVIVIASTHHERADGTGYPRRLTESRMNAAQLVLQFADAVSPLFAQSVDRAALAGKVREHLKVGQCSEAVSRAFYDNIDDVASHVEIRASEILQGYETLNKKYAEAS